MSFYIGGRKYLYTNDEWIGDPLVSGDISMIKKYELENHKRNLGLSELFDLNNSGKNKVHSNIEAALQELEDNDLIVDKLFDFKKTLEDEVTLSEERNIGSVSVNDYLLFLEGGKKNLHFIINNGTGSKEKINEDVGKIIAKYESMNNKKGTVDDEYVPYSLEDNYSKIHYSEIKELLKKNPDKDFISVSLRSTLGWNITDLSLFPIGSMQDFCKVATNLLTLTKDEIDTLKKNDKDSEKLMVDKLSSLIEVGSYGMKDKDELLAMINNKGITDAINICSKENVKELFEGDKDKSVKERTDELTGEKLINELKKAFSGNIQQSREFSIVVLYWLFERTTNVYKEVLLKNDKIGGKKIVEKICENLGKIWKSALVNYFKIDKKFVGKGRYGFIKGDKSGKISLSGDNKLIRVLGGESMINLNITSFNYPLVYVDKKFDEKKTIEKLIKMLSSVSLDEDTGKDLVMGGLIPDRKVAIASIQIMRDYLVKGVNTKKNNIDKINDLLKKMRNKIHIKYLIGVKNKLKREFKRISGETDKNSKDLVANTVVSKVLDSYQNLKNSELEKVIAVYKILQMMSSKKNELTKNMKAVHKLKTQKERLLIKFSQAQMKAIAFKEIALALYQEMILEETSTYNTSLGKKLANITKSELDKEALPMRYYYQMKEAFDQMSKDYADKLKEINVSKGNISHELIMGALNSNRSFHPDFWEKVFNKNVLSPIKANHGNSVGNSVTVRSEATNSDLSGVEASVVTQEFWNRVKEANGGKSIFIPFIRDRAALPNQHGVYDILESLIQGRIRKELFIFGSHMTEDVISRLMAPRGRIMVCGMDANLDRPTRWRLMRKVTLDGLTRMSERDLRLYFYRIFMDENKYNEHVNMYWSDTSETREKILTYCRMLGSYMECSLITSRAHISDKINNMK